MLFCCVKPFLNSRWRYIRHSCNFFFIHPYAERNPINNDDCCTLIQSKQTMRAGRYGFSSRRPPSKFRALAPAIPNCCRINNLKDTYTLFIIDKWTIIPNEYFLRLFRVKDKQKQGYQISVKCGVIDLIFLSKIFYNGRN